MKNQKRAFIAIFLLTLAIGCAPRDSGQNELTEAERDVLQNYYTSSATVEHAARICLIRQLTKAEVLANTSDKMGRKVTEDSITFFFAPSQLWRLQFDADGRALSADVNGKIITREQAQEGPNKALEQD